MIDRVGDNIVEEHQDLSNTKNYISQHSKRNKDIIKIFIFDHARLNKAFFAFSGYIFDRKPLKMRKLMIIK